MYIEVNQYLIVALLAMGAGYALRLLQEPGEEEEESDG